MTFRSIFVLLAMIAVSCQSPNSEMETLRTELSIAQRTLDSLAACERLCVDSMFVHTVFISLKEDITPVEKAEVTRLLLTLDQIDEVLDIRVAERTDVGDERALHHNLILYITFDSVLALKTYDKNEYHNEVRKKLKPYLAGPPATFDYELK